MCTRAAQVLDELLALSKKFPVERIMTSKADVADAFRNVRVDPDQTQNICYTKKRRSGRD